jgi:hypothetical protein
MASRRGAGARNAFSSLAHTLLRESYSFPPFPTIHKTLLTFTFFSIFNQRENIEAIGERLNRQLRVPRQPALGFHH